MRAPVTYLRHTLMWAMLGVSLLAVGFLTAKPSPPRAAFPLQMIPHHVHAAELAGIVDCLAVDENLHYFALNVVQTQRVQIAQMQGWLQLWRKLTSGLKRPSAHVAATMGMASQQGIAELLALEGRVAETKFWQLTIRRHQGVLPIIEQGSVEIKQRASRNAWLKQWVRARQAKFKLWNAG